MLTSWHLALMFVFTLATIAMLIYYSQKGP